MKRIVLTAFAALAAVCIASGQPLMPGQQPEPTAPSKFYPLDWHKLSFDRDSLCGAGIIEAREWLGDRKPEKNIVVAIIGTGFDPEHEDLKANVWVNRGETPGDGVDNDGNGYVDDVNGWNFLGTPDGGMIYRTSLETERYFMDNRERYDELYGNDDRSDEEQAELERIKSIFRQSDIGDSYMGINMAKAIMPHLEEINRRFIERFPDPADRRFSNYYGSILDRNEPDSVKLTAYSIAYFMMSDTTRGWDEVYPDRYRMIDDTRKSYENQLSLFGNDRPNAGDDLLDINDRGYGNGQLFTPRPSNATRMAGIIGAVTGNDTGMDGIVENVEMMFLRAVPDGDEFDKDIALAIRYAVDNGAKIINMGFSKRFSANPGMVEQAMSYAAEKGVLIVHGAGDSSSNTDTDKLYPTGTDESGDRLNNYLRVGASDPEGNVLPTSNYGAQTVDMFAPGIDIYSTAPGDNYLRHKGSSVSAGVVAGVAAMIWSYFPELTVAQLRDILVKGAVTRHGGQTKLPWNQAEENRGTIVTLSDISRAGGIVNALESVKLAAVAAEKSSGSRMADAALEEAVIDSAWLYIFNPLSYSAPRIESYTADGGVSAAFGGFCQMWQGWQSENNDRLIDGLGQMLGSAHYGKTSKIWEVTGIVLDRVLSTGDIAQTRAVIAAIDGAGTDAAPLKRTRELFAGKEILITHGLD